MENPELVLGIPLAILGAIGLIVAFSLFAVPAQAPEGGARIARRVEAHPAPSEYVVIFIVLAAITAAEVGLYYIEDLAQSAMIVMLLFMSAAKFALVIFWFMHLKFDSRLFTFLFLGGLALALAVFIVVIATLQAGLV